jgi:hypothetical protein
VAHGLVDQAAVGDDRLAERGAGLRVGAVLGDGLAQLAHRLVEIPRAAPRQAEPAVRLGEDRAIAAGLVDRARERLERGLVAAEQHEREAEADQRRRIAVAQPERALERLAGELGIARDEPRLAEDDQRLAVVGLGLEQRLEHVDRRRDPAGSEQLLRLIELIAVLVEHELAGQVAQPPLHARPQGHARSLQRSGRGREVSAGARASSRRCGTAS